MEFLTSKKETQRRKYAFLALISSFYIGLVEFSNLMHSEIASIFYFFLPLLFIIFYLLTSNYLNYLSKSIINIQDGYIERRNGKNSERFLISNIKSIDIKRRKNGNIREISISFSNNKSLYINAFEEDFKTIEKILLKDINKKVIIRERKEPIDYDNFFFYPILGLVISFVSIFIYTKVVLIDYSKNKMLFPLFSVYLFSLGIYFLAKKPISIRSGKDTIVADLIFGITMIIASILVFTITI